MKPRLIGRLQWYVPSESRADMTHLVDFEPTTYTEFRKVMIEGKECLAAHEVTEPTFCSCEAFNMLHHRPCKHQREVINDLVNSIPLTGEQREEMTARLEELCRQSPYWIGSPENDTSFKTKIQETEPKRPGREYFLKTK